jgi:hypothetical protein
MMRENVLSLSRRVMAALALAMLCLAAAPAQAVLKIDITRGNVDPLPIAISDLFGEDAVVRRTGAEMAGVRNPRRCRFSRGSSIGARSTLRPW